MNRFQYFPEGPLNPDSAPPWSQGTDIKPGDRLRSRYTQREAVAVRLHQENGTQRVEVLFAGQYRTHPGMNPEAFVNLRSVFSG